jgi:phage anti-repressor protein
MLCLNGGCENSYLNGIIFYKITTIILKLSNYINNMRKSNAFTKLLKKYTNIDKEFIDIFFNKFKIGGELDFNIKDIEVANYFNVSLNNIRRRLSNSYSKNINFIENVDYIKIKTPKTSSVLYLLNYQCFERLAMSGDSEKSEAVRMYFVKIRKFIEENQNIIYQTMNEKEQLKSYSTFETIYFFAIDERNNDIFKIGRTSNIIKRLQNYNVGRIREVNLKYLALVKNNLLIENCMKLKLKKNQIYKNKEIYKVKPSHIKKIIDICYCKNVSKKENGELYAEISNLLGLYSYTKDKINIKPFVIIGEKL